MSDGSIRKPSWFVAEIARDLGLEAGERHGLSVHALDDDVKLQWPLNQDSNWTADRERVRQRYPHAVCPLCEEA
jgi:hypothetical protein